MERSSKRSTHTFNAALLVTIFQLQLSPLSTFAFDPRDRVEPLTMPMSTLNRLVAANPHSTRALCDRGDGFLSGGDAESALPDFTAALKLDPRCARALVGRSRTYEMLGKTDDALKDAIAAVNEHDRASTANAVLQRLVLLRAKKRYVESIRDYEFLINCQGFGVSRHDRIILSGDLASLYLVLNKPRQAIAVIDRSVAAAGGHDARLFDVRAEADLELNDTSAALKDYGLAIACNRGTTAYAADRAKALLNRAKLYEKLGKKELAAADKVESKRLQSVDFDLVPFRSDH